MSWRRTFSDLFSDFEACSPQDTDCHCSWVAEGIRTVSLCKKYTKSSLSLTLCRESDSKARNLALYWGAINTYATTSSFPLAVPFSLENLVFIAAHLVPFFQDRLQQCLSKSPPVQAWSMGTRGMGLNLLMLSKRLKQSFPLPNAVTGDYSGIGRNVNALSF